MQKDKSQGNEDIFMHVWVEVANSQFWGWGGGKYIFAVLSFIVVLFKMAVQI